MASSDRLEELRDHCRAQAEQVQQVADQASPDLREAYLHLAQAWLQLAMEVDKAIEARENKFGQ